MTKALSESTRTILKTIIETKGYEPFTTRDLNLNIYPGAISGISARGYIEKTGRRIDDKTATYKRLIEYRLTIQGMSYAKQFGVI